MQNRHNLCDVRNIITQEIYITEYLKIGVLGLNMECQKNSIHEVFKGQKS